MHVHNFISSSLFSIDIVIDEQETDRTSFPTPKEVALISQHIVHWQELAKDLNLSEDEIHDLLQHNATNASEQCAHMLNYWLAEFACSKCTPAEQSPRCLLANTLRKQGYQGLADVLETRYVFFRCFFLCNRYCMVAWDLWLFM